MLVARAAGASEMPKTLLSQSITSKEPPGITFYQHMSDLGLSHTSLEASWRPQAPYKAPINSLAVAGEISCKEGAELKTLGCFGHFAAVACNLHGRC